MRNKNDIINDYINGSSLTELSKKEKVSRYVITRIIKCAGIKIVNR